MQNGQNIYQVTAHGIKQTIRKARKECAMHFGDDFCIEQEHLFQALSCNSMAAINSSPSPGFCVSYHARSSPISRNAREENLRWNDINHHSGSLWLAPMKNRHSDFLQIPPSGPQVRLLARVIFQQLPVWSRHYPKWAQRGGSAPAVRNLRVVYR